MCRLWDPAVLEMFIGSVDVTEFHYHIKAEFGPGEPAVPTFSQPRESSPYTWGARTLSRSTLYFMGEFSELRLFLFLFFSSLSTITGDDETAWFTYSPSSFAWEPDDMSWHLHHL
jgi:hypothetical protein